MMDEKWLEQEYRELKRQQAPDLWSRIEGNLQEHPERNPEEDRSSGKVLHKERKESIPFLRRQVYGVATAAAAVVALLVAAPKLMEGNFENTSSQREAPAMAETTKAETALEEDIVKMAPPEAGTDMAAAQAAPGASAGAAGSRDTRSEMSEPSMKMAGNALSDGVLTCSQLKLAACQPVAVPENAVTVAEDSRYFSEDILSEAELLCGGTVTGVSLEQDESGKSVKVVYEFTLDQVYFAEDYTTGMDRIIIKSPIVKADGDEALILYQLQPGGTYLLPLYRPDQDWELLYPFAPQIQVTGEGAYLFHSGYASLVNEDTSVVIGNPEGSNDYFYDRLVLRRDGQFLSDLLALIKH